MSVTSVDIPDESLAELMRLTGATTKKQAINDAVMHRLQILRQNEAIDVFLAAGPIGLGPEEAQARYEAHHRDADE